MTATIQAGNELDALVAEKVMGWKKCGWQRWPNHFWFSVPIGLKFPTGVARYPEDAPPYSTDIAAAWQVVEEIQTRERGWRFGLLGGDWQDGREFGWRGEFFGHVDPARNFGQRHGEAYADTAPLAICLAALKAMEAQQ